MKRPWRAVRDHRAVPAASAPPGCWPAWCSAVPAADVTAIVNTGDDTVLHGLHDLAPTSTRSPTRSPVPSTPSGAGAWPARRGRPWTRSSGTRRRARPDRRRPARGSASATRTWRPTSIAPTGWPRAPRCRRSRPRSRRPGASALRLLPMSDDPVRTMVAVAGEGEIGFQEYFVRPPARRGRHRRALRRRRRRPARARRARRDRRPPSAVVIAPSNPIVSIGPVLAVRRRARARSRRAATDVVAVSPIVGGPALKGPADRMLGELGTSRSASPAWRACTRPWPARS